MYLNLIKNVYDKPISNAILNGEEIETISSKVRKRQLCPLSLPLVNTVLEFLAKAIKQKKK
jgi:hypothetical protein